jgi:hypothetical protein
MPSIIVECPHCGADRVGFDLAAQQQRPTLITLRGGERFRMWDVLATCSKCEEAIIAVFSQNEYADARSPKSPTECKSDPENWGFSLVYVLPPPQPSRVPEHLPELLPNIFLQASNALKRGDWDASGAMSRKTIDVATKDLMQNEARQIRDLGPRIDALAKAGRLTEDLRQWAQHVRLGGNDAAHDEDPFTKAEAEELLDFTELFLTYVYTLPGRLKEKMKPHPS